MSWLDLKKTERKTIDMKKEAMEFWDQDVRAYEDKIAALKRECELEQRRLHGIHLQTKNVEYERMREEEKIRIKNTTYLRIFCEYHQDGTGLKNVHIAYSHNTPITLSKEALLEKVNAGDILCTMVMNHLTHEKFFDTSQSWHVNINGTEHVLTSSSASVHMKV